MNFVVFQSFQENWFYHLKLIYKYKAQSSVGEQAYTAFPQK